MIYATYFINYCPFPPSLPKSPPFYHYYYYFPTVNMWNCHYHPDTQLQNFCANPACSLPMCPKCIHIHLHDFTQQHHILPLEDSIQMIKEQILTCLNGLKEEKSLLEGQYHPKQILANYQTLIEKYKSQTVSQIERYYQSLKEQLLLNLTNLYNETVAQLNYPIQQKIDSLEKYLRKLQNRPTVLQTIISINCENFISETQQFFTFIKEKKSTLGSLLPRLEAKSDGKLHIPLYKKNKFEGKQSRASLAEEVSGIQKINGLQERLLNLRTGAIY